MDQVEDIEDLTAGYIKEHPILFCKLTRQTSQKHGKIETAIHQVHSAVQYKMEITIPLRTISQVWSDSLMSAKCDLKHDSHYVENDLITDDEEDMPIIEKLVDTEEAQMFAAFEVNSKRKTAAAAKSKNRGKASNKCGKHRLGKQSKLPVKKSITKHPKLHTSAEKRVKGRENMMQEFKTLKEQFLKSTQQVIQKNSNTYWQFVCEKFHSIRHEDYDACLDEAIEELENLMEY